MLKSFCRTRAGDRFRTTTSLPAEPTARCARPIAPRSGCRASRVRKRDRHLVGDFLDAPRASGSGVLEHQRRAADAAALKAPDREVETYRGRTVVELDDRAVVAGQVARADPRTDADAISDAQRREPMARSRSCGAVARVRRPPPRSRRDDRRVRSRRSRRAASVPPALAFAAVPSGAFACDWPSNRRITIRPNGPAASCLQARQTPE